MTGGTGGSTVADAAVDTLVRPGDAASDAAVVPCGASGQTCCAGNTCVGGGCCVGNMCVGNGAKCSTGGTCSNGSCTACDPTITTGQACATGLPGICAAGTQKCTAAGVWGTCVQNVAIGTRDCSSKLDNDCDGVLDNSSSTCACPAGNSQSCSTGLLGVCAAGTQQCVLSSDKASTAWGACVQTTTAKSSAQTTAGPNGSWDWNCDGMIKSTYLDVGTLRVPCASRQLSECTGYKYWNVLLGTTGCGDTFTATVYNCMGPIGGIGNCTTSSLGSTTGTYTQSCY